MRRVMVAVLAALVGVTTACSGSPGSSGEDGAGTAETLALYSSGGAAAPVSQLGLPATELKDAFLVSPHQTIKFARWVAAPELTSDQLMAAGLEIKDADGFQVADQALRAPEGHELFIVDADNPDVIPMSQKDALKKVSFALVVGGKSRDLGNSLSAYNLRDALLAVVPAGAEVRLDLTDEGRTQSLDLRTGKRAVAVAAFYPLRQASAGPSERWRYRGSTYTSIIASLNARLSPWTEEKGWAPAGRAWLTGKVSVSVGSLELPLTSKSVRTPATIQVDLGRDLRLSGSGMPARLWPAGTTVFAADPLAPGLPEEATSRAFTVSVPEKLTKFTATFATKVDTPGYVRDPDQSDKSRVATLEAPPR
ncbi:hypothetical protein [Paractinoplanes lichenicola]|uniref:Lipoprotein n=1 Tax=Paractinoplanes lichenicola TaxID=2802976 RepID=A0ABS1VMJ3_9ACTN|nr:hypothetical protein [Actinoplanes lichenicola]MBL7255344.1 hypothetical protein [Actinoplanes lichenicola]